MKNIKTSQWLLGAGIVALIYILYKKQQQKSQDEEVIEVVKEEPTSGSTTSGATTGSTTTGGTTTVSTTIDTSGIPKQCLNGFDLKGVRYSIKGDKFIKE